MSSGEIRSRFLMDNLFRSGEVTAFGTFYDRMAILGVSASTAGVILPSFDSYTKASYFLERRELGVFNVGGSGSISVDGQVYNLVKGDCLYIGKGAKKVDFASDEAQNPAKFYMNSCPAHASYPTRKASVRDANTLHLGSEENANVRTLRQFIYDGGVESCQLVMGYTELARGNVWNTFPPHTHLRRMEVYFYYDVPSAERVVHLMGDPEETKHIMVGNEQAVISPEWSLHAGAGTSAYSFVWGMAGENKQFTDMDAVASADLM